MKLLWEGKYSSRNTISYLRIDSIRLSVILSLSHMRPNAVFDTMIKVNSKYVSKRYGGCIFSDAPVWELSDN